MPTVQTPLEEQTATPIAVPRIVSEEQVQSYLATDSWPSRTWSPATSWSN